MTSQSKTLALFTAVAYAVSVLLSGVLWGVGAGAYHWRANGQDWGIEVVVVTGGAFARGEKAQQLMFTLDYDHLRTPRADGAVALTQRAAVAQAGR